MKISIITPTYNSESTIRDTINSIINQNYIDLEYIIIDGVSSDKTLEIIEEYQSKIKIKLISEPDKGLYDAMNKGINLATGDIVGILNSDDFYNGSDVLTQVNQVFLDNNIDAVYADLQFVDQRNIKKVVRTWISGRYKERKIANGWIVPHPTFFVKKEIYNKHGYFNLKFRIAADYEFLLRLIKLHKIKLYYIPKIIVNMRTGGVSGCSFKQRKRGWRELKEAWTENNLKPPFLFVARRILFKIVQYF
jgi:glycosyltransferase